MNESKVQESGKTPHVSHVFLVNPDKGFGCILRLHLVPDEFPMLHCDRSAGCTAGQADFMHGLGLGRNFSLSMTTQKKIIANRANAKTSTGPKTPKGKALSSANATRHGLLSRELMLPHEIPDEFDKLLEALISELGASGMLECTLVERIAVAIWRQRRLVRAERQDILRQSEGMGPVAGRREAAVQSFSDEQLIEKMLSSAPHVDNLDEIEREIRMLAAAEALSDEDYVKKFPKLAPILPRPTGLSKDTFSSLKPDQLYGPLDGLQRKWLRGVLTVREQRAEMQANRGNARAGSIPSDTDRLARYQAALDNEWYKAMRAFRETRQHRLRTLDEISVPSGTPLADHKITKRSQKVGGSRIRLEV